RSAWQCTARSRSESPSRSRASRARSSRRSPRSSASRCGSSPFRRCASVRRCATLATPRCSRGACAFASGKPGNAHRPSSSRPPSQHASGRFACQGVQTFMNAWHRARGALVPAMLGALTSAIAPARAAEATTGIIAGSVVDAKGAPLAGARVTAASPSGRYEETTDAHGAFALLGVSPDTYTVSVQRTGYRTVVRSGITVLPGQTARATFELAPALQTIGRVSAVTNAFTVGTPSDVFTVSGAAARAYPAPANPSGLANYTAGTVQGAIANVPGIDLDPFANAILRGTKVSDAVFDYDSVPIPQGLIAEPGGNVIGAQMPTTGIASTTVALAGYQSESDNALGGVVNEIAAVGTYPARTTLELGNGIGSDYHFANLQLLGATPDLRWRYALAATSGSEYFRYGDGSTFYPSEAATYGLALQDRGEFSIESNAHYRAGANDDVSFLALVGQATYDQYGSPYPGETIGAFDGTDRNGNVVPYPGYANQNAPADFASGIRGQYDILKAAWLHT